MEEANGQGMAKEWLRKCRTNYGDPEVTLHAALYAGFAQRIMYKGFERRYNYGTEICIISIIAQFTLHNYYRYTGL